ncbi:MAG TPA: TetR/AcrR family transcriptional regulator [Candidatus Limnocylindrales bacterium]|nr:TetR/AcrR family transcriptional regulator [Candidatus Limnocylindrales bacterium]
MTELGAERRERARLEKRRIILKAALRTFADIGYERATISDILRRAEMTTSTFYNYFPDKDSVFLALVADAVAPVLAEIDAWVRSAEGLQEMIERVCRVCFRQAVRDQALRKLLARNTHKLRSLVQEPAVREKLGQVEAELRSAMERGAMPAVNARLLAASLIGITIETALRLLEDEAPDADAATRFVSSMIVGGVDRVAEEDEGSSGGGMGGDSTTFSCASF